MSLQSKKSDREVSLNVLYSSDSTAIVGVEMPICDPIFRLHKGRLYSISWSPVCVEKLNKEVFFSGLRPV